MPTGADSRRDLVRRVAASREFRRCARLRELLVLVCEHALQDPSRELRSSEVAATYARPPLGDARQADNLVRAHMTRLRQRLAEYFAEGGAREDVVIEIPTPGCTPVFRARHMPRAAARRSPATMIAAVVAVLLLASVAFGLRRVEPPGLLDGEAPAVGRFWAQMFGRRARLSLVLGTVDDGRAEEGPLTSMADARVAQRVGALAGAGGLDVEILSARDAGAALVRNGDAILTGPPRANPWLAPFEARLNFRALLDDAAPGFENVRPRGGEVRRYVAGEGRGYCRVAWLPSLDGSGSILLLSGTEMASTEAGLELVTRGLWVERLRARLQLRPGEAYSHFEALLATEVFASSSARFELIGARRVPYPAGG